MCNSRLYYSFILIAIFGLISSPSLTCSEEIKGQKPMVVIEDTFQFIPGTWARYTVRDKKKQQDYEMTMAVLNKEKRDGVACSWMEVIIRAQNTPKVVTRFLTPITSKGPGKPLEAIVQMEGYDPFTVPDSFMEGENAEVGQQQNYHLGKKLNKKTIKTAQGKTVEIWQVEAVNNQGQQVTVWVSEQLPPLGLYKFDTPDTGMYIEDWGTGARSKITGDPMNFYLWLASLIGKAVIQGPGE